MANPIHFEGANRRLVAPEGAENVQDMSTYTNGVCSVSCWKLTPREVAEINRTGRVFVSVMFGTTQPPIFVGDEESVRGVVVDFGGVWPKEAG